MQAPSTPSLLRKTAPFLCPRQRSQLSCPLVEIVAARLLCRLLPLLLSSAKLLPFSAPRQRSQFCPCVAARTLCVVTPRTRVRPVDICCDSACAPGTLCRTPTLRYADISPASLLGAVLLLRKTAPFLCPRQQSQFCPSGGRGFAHGGTQLSFHTEIPGEGRLRALSGDRFCMPVSHAGFAKRRVSCRVPRRRRQC